MLLNVSGSGIRNIFNVFPASDFGGTLHLVNAELTGGTAILELGGFDWSVHVHNVSIDSTVSQGLIYSTSTGQTYKIYGEAEAVGTLFGTSAATPVLELHGFGFSEDMDKCIRTAGTFFTNTDAAKGTGVAPVYCDGSVWTSLVDGTTQV